MFQNLFGKTSKSLPFLVDIHSHLLPGLDDGVKSMEETLYILQSLIDLGYKKVITTPHVMSDQYPNSPEDILVKLSELNRFLDENNLDIEVEAAAEYYLDEQFLQKLSNGEALLTFHHKHLLFETSFINKPVFLEEAIFEMNTNGFQPVLAHPERYAYLTSDRSLLEKLKNMNVLFQINMLSLFGYYSVEVKKNALKLIKLNLVDFIGTDCHNTYQVEEIVKNVHKKSNSHLHKLKVLNQTLI